MRKVEFVEDFATKKKGDVWECDSLLAARLVSDGVAKHFKGRRKKKTEE